MSTTTTKATDSSVSGAPAKVVKPADTSVNGSKGKGTKIPISPMMDVPKVVLPSPTFPAMDYLVQGSAITRARVEHLQQSAEFIFKAVAPIPQLQAAITAVKSDNAVESQRITKLDKKVDAQGRVLANILANQEAMMKSLKSLLDRPASFTADDRTSLSTILANQSAQTSAIHKMASDVQTTLIHVLSDDHPEGERSAKELADELLGVMNANLSTPTSPYIKKTSSIPGASQPDPIVVGDEKDDEEEEEEEDDDDDDEDDDEIHLIGGNDDDDEDDDEIHHIGGNDDDDDDLEGAAMKHFAQAHPSISMPEFSQQPLGDGSTPSQGSDPSGKNK